MPHGQVRVVEEDDCGTLDGSVMRAIVEGGEVIESLRDRVLGRTVVEDVLHLRVQPRDLAHDQAADHEHGGQRHAVRRGHQQGPRARLVLAALRAAQVQRAGREGADRPDDGQAEGRWVEQRVARLDPQREGEDDSTDDHEAPGDRLTPPQVAGRLAVVAGHLVPQRPTHRSAEGTEHVANPTGATRPVRRCQRGPAPQARPLRESAFSS